MNAQMLAVTGTQRMPDVPTFQELGYKSLEPYGWFGMLLPEAVRIAPR